MREEIAVDVETKWEKFAREKGIQNKKKSRMVWDETRQEWAPRWGYKRANDDNIGIVELLFGGIMGFNFYFRIYCSLMVEDPNANPHSGNHTALVRRDILRSEWIYFGHFHNFWHI